MALLRRVAWVNPLLDGIWEHRVLGLSSPGLLLLHSKRAMLFLLLAAAAGLCSEVVRAAEPSQRVARVGFVAPLSPAVLHASEAEFWKRLRELGWVAGDNLVIEKRSAEGRLERLPALMAE